MAASTGASGAAWGVPTASALAADRLAAALTLPAPIARVLMRRGIQEVDAARAFLNPSLDQLHSPAKMLGMSAAVARLRAALSAGEPILIYGDYDVDGTVATVLLKTALERAAAFLGVAPDVRFHIPHRIREGYGMQESRITAAATEGVRLVVSVDTGIRAFAAAEEAARCGVDLIVTDHHLPDASAGVPQAAAVLNPNQPGCAYPCKDLCGAAVAFKLAQALLEDCAPGEEERTRLREKTLPSFLKLLAIATIADAVPLTGENRVIAAVGLRELQQPAQSGLRELMLLAGLEPASGVSAYDVGFRLAPRLNAAGRMDIASDVVELFLTREPAVARTLAEKLHRLNGERRSTESEALRAIEARLEQMKESSGTSEGLPWCLVLDDPEWHRGVIGILASRVADRTGRPALVLAHEGDQAYGSGRSVAGYPLLDALTAVHAPDGLFTRFGGHAHAVGFALPSSAVAMLRERMEAHAAGFVDLRETAALDCDAELRLDEITPAFLAALDRLAPFGNGNPEPVFVTRGLRLRGGWRTIAERHLRFCLEDAMGQSRTAVAWSRRVDWVAKASESGWTHGTRVDVVYKLRRQASEYGGGSELDIVDLRCEHPGATGDAA